MGTGEPHTGQAVSFVFEEGSKGAAAVSVREEEGEIAREQDVQEEEREMGMVKVCKGGTRSSSSFMLWS